MSAKKKNSPLGGGRQGPICWPVVIDPRGLLIPSPTQDGPISIDRPARKIPPKRRSIAGSVPFQSMGRMVRFESTLESNVLDILATCQPRFGVVEQPVKLSTKALGYGQWTYVPDFLVWVRRGPLSPWEVVLLEVKMEGQLRKDWEFIRPKLMAARRFARRQGWRFLLITERHLRRPAPVIGAWPRIHQEAWVLTPVEEFLARLFGGGGL